MSHLSALPVWFVLLSAGVGAPASAQTVYQCTGAHGEASYQSTPCPRAQRQRQIVLDPAPATPAPDRPSAPVSVAPPPLAAAASPPPPAAPIPTLYQCVRATDGKTYVSRNGQPPGYYAPLGILGVPTPLAEQYNAGNHMGREQANAATVSSYYTFVRDRCRALGPQETCAVLRKDWGENERKLSRAFKSDQPPLLKREAELRAQLQGCGGP